MQHAYLSRFSIRSGLPLLLAAGALLLAPSASAQEAQPNCDPLTLLCSNGTMPDGHVASSMDRLPTGVDTGYLPRCSDGTPHCDKHLQVRAQIAFDPIKSGGPIYSVEMTRDTTLDVRWPDTDYLTFGLAKGKATSPVGKLTVAHGMTPEFAIYINVPFYTGEIKLDASILVNYIPGGSFNYAASGNTRFAPWGFDGADVEVKGTDLNNSRLFQVSFEQLGQLVGTNGFNDYIEGNFSFNATTDSTFSYATDKVVIGGADQPITYADGTAKIGSPDADYIDVQAHAEGTIRYEGDIQLKIVIGITSVMNTGVTLDWPINVYSYHYASNTPIPVVFPTQNVHVPLPNVFVPSTPINFGTVQTGSKSEDKIVTIENTGEMGAQLEFSSSDRQFKVNTPSVTVGPKEEYQLAVRFQPTTPGHQEATITIKSNDPDTPEQTVRVVGEGEGADIPDDPGEPDAGPGADSGTDPGSDSGTGPGPIYDNPSSDSNGGCGCAVPAHSAPTAAGLFALLGLGLALARRRR